MTARPRTRHGRLDRRAGVPLDLVVGSALVILGAFALYALGFNFGEILRGAGDFFGV
jgi:hypothetical protein